MRILKNIILALIISTILSLPIGYIVITSDIQPVKNTTIVDNVSVVKPSENFTPTKNNDTINVSISKLKYIYKYQFVDIEKTYVRVGYPSPNITFRVFSEENEETPLDNMKTYSLIDFRGKDVVLNFWASWCDPCREEFPVFQEFHSSNPDVVVLMIDVDNSDYRDARNFINRNAYTLPVVYDGKLTSDVYGLYGIPRSIYIDKTGLVKRIKIGYFIDVNELSIFVRGIK
jgi:thiol-disulfide isomerase/thioredoxin